MVSRKKIKRYLKLTALLIIIAWIIAARLIMQFRISDRKAKQVFAEDNTVATFHDVKIGRRTLHYVQTGNDSLPTIVFIHGSPGSWSAFMQYLSDSDLNKKYRLIAIDRPGFGYSGFGSTCDLPSQAKYISQLLHKLDNKKPLFLLGHSLGGPLALKLAADNSDIVRGIVILAGSVDPGAEKKELWRPVVIYSPLRWLVPSAWRYSNDELWWLKKDLVKLKDDFPKVTCAVYILHGDKDHLVPVSNAAYAKQMLLHAVSVQTIILPGQDHFIPWTKFKEIKGLLLTLQ